MSEITTTGLTAHPARAAAGYPIVQGRCPCCGAKSLFLAQGGYVTCASLNCTDPSRASEILDVIAEPDRRRAEHMNRTLRRAEGGDET